MADRYTNQANTAPVVSSMKNKKLPVPHSYFDLTCPIAFDAPIGAIIPFDLIETLPDSDYEISYDILALTKNPLVRRLLSGMTVYIHTYASDSKSLWEGFPTFVSRGRSGTITRKIPTSLSIIPNFNGVTTDVATSSQYSPSAYLGLKPDMRCSYSVDSNALLYYTYRHSIDLSEAQRNRVEFNALPLVMYQQICIHNYLPSNLLQANKHFFPDDEMHLKLSPTCGQNDYRVYSLSYDDSVATAKPTLAQLQDVSISSPNTPVVLDTLRVRQFQGDRFNTGLPWPELVRGDIPAINIAENVTLTGTGEVVIPSGQDLSNALYVGSNTQDVSTAGNNTVSRLRAGHPDLSDSNSGLIFANSVLSYGGTPSDYSEVYLDGVNTRQRFDKVHLQYPLSGTSSTTVSGQFQSSITLSQLNALKVLTLMRQRAALTDGSYNELIKAQYNTSPDLQVGKPFYIGGTKQPLVFSEVVQTSESSNDSPLGRTGSRAVSAGSGYIGRFHSKDFGYIMSVLSVVPDVYYTQGIDKLWTRVNHDDYHFPLMDNLEPSPILNKEVYHSGDSSVDDDVFAYQERDSEYKSRRPVLRGNMQYSSSVAGVEEDSAYTMKRIFSTTPTLSYGFTGMFPENVDYSVFTNTIDCPFIFSITSRIHATLPLPYVTMPNDGLSQL